MKKKNIFHVLVLTLPALRSEQYNLTPYTHYDLTHKRYVQNKNGILCKDFNKKKNDLIFLFNFKHYIMYCVPFQTDEDLLKKKTQ